MNLHSLSNRPGARHAAHRLGRGHGSGSGKTSGRGHKGQGARAGSRRKLGFEGGQMPLIRRLPKRGFKTPGAPVCLAINVGRLERLEPNTEVTPQSLRAAGLAKGPWDLIKILGQGQLTRPLRISAHAFSAAARAKIEAAGGECIPLQAGPRGS